MNSNNTKIIFTRYLYIKEEVEYSLLLSLLNKSDDALFWGYELYYSGFEEDLIYLLLKIYYDFYSSLNPTFEGYLIKKINDFIETNDEYKSQSKNEENESYIKVKIIGSIINNLLLRNFNCDIFYLRIMNNNNLLTKYLRNENTENNLTSNIYDLINDEMININSEEIKIEYDLIDVLIKEKKIILLAYLILNKEFNILDFYKKVLLIFNDLNLNLNTKKLFNDFKKLIEKYYIIPINIKIILLSKILEYYQRLEKKLNVKSFYLILQLEEILVYETINKENSPDLENYNILKIATMCGINDLRQLNIFDLSRHKLNKIEKETKTEIETEIEKEIETDTETNYETRKNAKILNIYRNNWLYYCINCPLWKKRLNEYNIIINDEKETIEFINEDEYEDFYENYNLEPDEQPLTIQQKNIGLINIDFNFNDFYEKFKHNGYNPLINLNNNIIKYFEIYKIIY